MSGERCEVCNAELSRCGIQGADGEPSLDCLVCKLREQLAAEREKYFSLHADYRYAKEQLAAEREELEIANNRIRDKDFANQQLRERG